ncbi:caspase family protein [Ramlibacter albus]|uniref:Caspase family protein n=1 Tax=Ramlibacter albus TaxID=2079448 RepID=A0A923S4X5_9BURK|nr:caspase family protein [Ramlibacter albus]MBC5764587.1 caspase family protein [Ramlibacter albus]
MRLKTLAAAALAACAIAQAQDPAVQVLRATELRADKLPTAAVLRQLPQGARVQPLSLEGGWAWVQAGSERGWVRAGTLQLATATAAAASVPSARMTAGTMQTLGVRSLTPRANRHALVITVGTYADPNIAPLPGTRVDVESATQIARAMEIPQENIRYLADEKATGDGIRKALRELEQQMAEGDRVYIHFSGHGTRTHDAAAGGCVESLLAHDGGARGTLTNREMADLLAPLTRKADKMFVMYDACHSGGVLTADAGIRTRGLLSPGDEGRLRPKFSPASDECSRPANVKTRNLLPEVTAKGVPPNDVVHLSSSRDNEISFDDEDKGGLATQFVRDCLLRDAKDLDGSGAVTIDEIRQCAQAKLVKRLEKEVRFQPSTLLIQGNAGFVPTWFSAVQLVAAALPTTTKPLTGAEALQQVYDQRDAKRDVRVQAARNRLAIGKDYLEFSVTANRKGYVYVAMAGSDNQSLYVLFPNELDKANTVEPGKPLALPRDTWRVRASGPAGTNELLVLVTDAPRDLSQLPAAKLGPFIKSLNNQEGRANLGALLTREPFGAAMFKIEETQ